MTFSIEIPEWILWAIIVTSMINTILEIYKLVLQRRLNKLKEPTNDTNNR